MSFNAVEDLRAQREYARKHKELNEKSRIQYPAAYFVFIAGFTAIFSRGDMAPELNPEGSILAGIVGIGIFFIACIEHHFYCAFREWEKALEKQLTDAADRPESEYSVSNPEKHTEKILWLLDFQRARGQVKDIAAPNVSQSTMNIVLLLTALTTSFFVYKGIAKFISAQAGMGVGIVVFLFLVISFKFWNSFGYAVVSTIERLLRTSGSVE